MEEFTLNEFVFQGLQSVLQTPPENAGTCIYTPRNTIKFCMK